MKLAFCEKCNTLLVASRNSKTCQCGYVKCRLKDDGSNVLLISPGAIPVSIDEKNFKEAIRLRPQSDPCATIFDAFVLPVQSRGFEIDDENSST